MTTKKDGTTTAIKYDLMQKLSKKFELPKEAVLDVIEHTFKEIGDKLARGESVQLRGFCTFIPVVWAKRKGYNFDKRKTMDIPAHTGVKLKLSKKWKTQINKSKKGK